MTKTSRETVERKTGLVNRQTLRDVLADPGYSADKRKDWLKQALTDLEQRRTAAPSSETDAMIEEVKAALSGLQPESQLEDDR